MKQLKKLRRRVGLTQSDIARALGKKRWEIAHFENGLLKLSHEDIAKIKRVLIEASQANAERVSRELGIDK